MATLLKCDRCGSLNGPDTKPCSLGKKEYRGYEWEGDLCRNCISLVVRVLCGRDPETLTGGSYGPVPDLSTPLNPAGSVQGGCNICSDPNCKEPNQKH